MKATTLIRFAVLAALVALPGIAGAQNLAAADAKKLEGSFDALRNGSPVGFHTAVSSLASHTITEQHIMQVKVGYEPRPIGGILTVRVELVPVFAGIRSEDRRVGK